MYRINPSDAMVSLYGVGKGEAQVIDLGLTERNQNAAYQERVAKEAAKLKRQQSIDDDFNNNLSKMGQVKIMPRDQQLFADKANDIYSFVKNNHEALRNGDTGKTMEFQQLYGDYMTKANLSMNTRENWEQVGMQLAKDPDAVLPESKDYFKQFGTSEHAGNWQFDPTQIVQKINTFERVQDLEKFAKERANATQTPWRETFTKDQAKQMLKDDYLSDPALMRQLNSDFNNAEDKLGAKDPLEYYQNKNADYLYQNLRKAGPQATADKDKSPFPNVSSVVTNNRTTGETTATVEFTDKTKNAPVIINNPQNKDESLEVIPRAIIRKKGGKIYLKVSTLPHGEGENRVEGQNMELDYDDVADVMNTRFGIDNPVSFLEGNAPKHVTIKKYDISPKDTSVKSGPKKGDEKAIQGGTAMYNGTKWVMKK